MISRSDPLRPLNQGLSLKKPTFGGIRTKIDFKYRLGFFAAFFLLSAWADNSFALRCGTRLVSEGDSRAEVLHKCGAPDSVESWEEERIGRDLSSGPLFDDRSRRGHGNRIPLLVKEQVRVEEWTYNLGSTQFIRYLRFENGILTEIVMGDRGY